MYMLLTVFVLLSLSIYIYIHIYIHLLVCFVHVSELFCGSRDCETNQDACKIMHCMSNQLKPCCRYCAGKSCLRS